ncbi:UDP-N-acetylmuramate--alanine ligase [Yoonia litorea]|uniref:Uncharacterized protein n=1 Tax=Yoonia litorea TaxID=1123755 RepID=A0A1I6MFE9_9RHOB|nr:UDP-N-acetylmuramate--alanine ligase [Yoonia litorea]SFS14434.1 hypothetical protein SAMN05444714_1697 [Yoonia litorea]
MADLAIIAIMLASAAIPFVWLTRLVRRGHSGLALTILSILGGVLAVLLYASGRPFGLDPVQAMGASLLLIIPALAGACAGALLGWLLRRRDDRGPRSD